MSTAAAEKSRPLRAAEGSDEVEAEVGRRMLGRRVRRGLEEWEEKEEGFLERGLGTP